jgi:bacteriorhodopsin
VLNFFRRKIRMEMLNFAQFELVSNAFSFAIAVMGAATVFLFLGRSQVAPQYKTAVTISGIVTLIAFYHYWRIFDSWHGAFSVTKTGLEATANKFNDAYRYVDWLLTVPLLLIELILVMRLSREETISKAQKLAFAAALMILLGYPGEVATDMGTKFKWWFASMVPFVYIIMNLYSGLSKAINSQPESVRELIATARNLTVISWCFYPVVYALYFLPGTNVASAEVTTWIQIGYTIADIVAKAVFGVFIFVVAVRKSETNA